MCDTMHVHNYPFAVRMIGFAEQEANAIAASFEEEQGKSYGYFRLLDDNLQDPDLYLVNADELRALVTLSDLTPTDARPALLVGRPNLDLPYPCLTRPLQNNRLFQALDALIEKRADALSRLGASGIVSVPERRRRDRLDLDLTDPTEYRSMRAGNSAKGSILLIDKNPAFRDYVSELLVKYNIPVVWVKDESNALDLCEEHQISVVLINTSTPGIEAYDLAVDIKTISALDTTKVVFLVGKPFVYDIERARTCKVDGFMNKPIASHHLLAVLKKFLPVLSR
jgi:CheY-like chemotaxis protein